MDLQHLATLYQQHITLYLRYRVGDQLAERITKHVLGCENRAQEPRQAFARMLDDTLDFTIGEHKVLPLVFDRAELAGFHKKFLSIVDEPEGASDFDAIFDKVVSGYLEDILGKELVTTVKRVFMKAVSAVPDQPLDIRFFMGMQAIYQFIPAVWSELEFAEKVKELSDLLPQDTAMQTIETPGTEAGFQQLVEKVVIADLADILGRGHALETVMTSANGKTEGIFYNDLDKFKQFIEHVLADDFITRMFDSFWIDECRTKWLREAALILD